MLSEFLSKVCEIKPVYNLAELRLLLEDEFEKYFKSDFNQLDYMLCKLHDRRLVSEFLLAKVNNFEVGHKKDVDWDYHKTKAD